MKSYPTLRELLEGAVQEVPHDWPFAHWHDGTDWRVNTYAETLERVKIFAEWFGEQGLVPRKTKVALILPNSPMWIELYLSVVSISGTVVPIDPKLTPSEVHYILSDSGAAFVITDASHLKSLASMAPTLPDLRGVLSVDPVPAEFPVKGACVADVLAAAPDDLPLRFWNDAAYRPQEEDICGVLYTSGTTGQPKGAMLTHRNFSADAACTLDLVSGGVKFVTPDDNFMVVLPLFHAFSFLVNFVVALQARSQMSYMRSLRTIVDDVAANRPTVLAVVPLMAEKIYARLMEKAKATWAGRMALRFFPRVIGKRVHQTLGGRLRVIIAGGAKSDPEILRGFNRMGVPMVEGYGLTECAPVVCVCPPRRIRIGSIGPIIWGVEGRIANPDPRGVGELQVRGPITFKGYWNKPEATEESFDGDWLRTGDLASIDSEGYVTIRGRAKSLIVNREGKNIYPEEVEQAIARNPLVESVIVMAYHAHGEPGEKVGVLLSPSQEQLDRLHPGATPEEVEKLLRDAVHAQCEALAAYKHPRKIVVSMTPLELTSTHKVRRGIYAGTLDE